MNTNFSIGQSVICIWGINKGLHLTISSILSDSYSCVDVNGKYYCYNDNTLKGV